MTIKKALFRGDSKVSMSSEDESEDSEDDTSLEVEDNNDALFRGMATYGSLHMMNWRI